MLGWTVTPSRRATRRRIPAHFAIGAEGPLSRGELGSIQDRQHSRIREIGANVRYHLGGPERASGMDTVGEKDHEHLALGINPHRRAGESSVSVCGGSQVAAGAVIAFSGVPAERTVTERSGREELDGRLADELHALV